ncbi:MAG: branched-chain amino acid ABC transporter permease [Alphaproteobacteria bacterium]|nr:branched-chain amino acid ABC transporter permease [Alphaproteobacteria bacterium]
MRTALWVGAAALPIAVTLWGPPMAVDIAFRACALVMLAVSWNMMAGAGLISLGHSGFWGLGSYAAILVANDFGFPFWLSLLPAMLCGALVGAGLALVTRRLRGIYFAISTLAMSEGLRVIAVMLPDLTGGSNGVYLDSSLSPGMLAVELLACAGAIGAVAVAYAVARSRYHFALRAMRDNEAASQMLGVAPARFRLGILAVSGAIASLAGAINVWYGGYLDPEVAFDLQTTINAQIAAILGGIYTLPGPVVGAVTTIALGEITRLLLGNTVGGSLLVFGLVLVIVVLLLPYGLWGFVERQRRRPRRAAARLEISEARQ